MKTKSSKKYTLVNQDIDTSLLTLEMTWRGMLNNDLEKYIGPKPESFLEIIKGQTINYYADSKEIDGFIKRCAKEVLSNKDFLNLLIEKTISTAKEMREYALHIYPRIGELQIDEIPQILEKISDLQERCTVYGAPFAFCDVKGDITSELIKIVQSRKGLKLSVHEYTTLLGLPNEKSLTEKAYEEIRNSKDDNTLLSKYFWLDQGYIGKGLNKDELKEIRNHKNSSKEKFSRGKIIKELCLNEEELYKFYVSQNVVAMKSLRIDSRQFLNVVLNRLVEKISSHLKIEINLLNSMTAKELAALIKNSKNLPLNLKERYAHSIFTRKNDSYQTLVGGDADDFLIKYVEEKKQTETKEIKGQVAQVGCVRGIVKIVFGPQHLKKVLEGDILVSVVTSPQLLPAMKRAAAFITDIGGITSHAAIVARELKKPCIIGTKMATKILKDGDLVEVDANTGVVRIIKKADER